MGTRGLKGFKLDGKYYGTYNHFDSYLEVLGEDMVHSAYIYLQKDKIESAKANIRNLKDMTQDALDDDDLYQVTQNEGYIDDVLDGKHEYYFNYADFLRDSLSCEYGYVIDFDDEKLMLFKGFQKEPQEGNPFGTDKDSEGYYPCKYLGSIDVLGKGTAGSVLQMYEMFNEPVPAEETNDDNDNNDDNDDSDDNDWFAQACDRARDMACDIIKENIVIGKWYRVSRYGLVHIAQCVDKGTHVSILRKAGKLVADIYIKTDEEHVAQETTIFPVFWNAKVGDDCYTIKDGQTKIDDVFVSANPIMVAGRLYRFTGEEDVSDAHPSLFNSVEQCAAYFAEVAPKERGVK